jgi:hypothetical protein
MVDFTSDKKIKNDMVDFTNILETGKQKVDFTSKMEKLKIMETGNWKTEKR